MKYSIEKHSGESAYLQLYRELRQDIATGAVARGFKTAPYPAPKLVDYIRAGGGRFVLSSDAHRPEDVGYKIRELGECIINA